MHVNQTLHCSWGVCVSGWKATSTPVQLQDLSWSQAATILISSSVTRPPHPNKASYLNRPVYLLILGYAAAAATAMPLLFSALLPLLLLLLLHTCYCCRQNRPWGFANPPPPQHPPGGSVAMICFIPCNILQSRSFREWMTESESTKPAAVMLKDTYAVLQLAMLLNFLF